MVTTPYPIEEEPTKVEHLRVIARGALHEVVAGSPTAPIRRIALYVVSATTILLLAANGEGHPERLIAGGIGLIAILLNALTDEARR